MPEAKVDREALGRAVREVWIAWANEQPDPKKLSWLVPWDQLCERDKEVDRRIGETVYRMGVEAERERTLAGLHEYQRQKLAADARATEAERFAEAWQFDNTDLRQRIERAVKYVRRTLGVREMECLLAILAPPEKGADHA